MIRTLALCTALLVAGAASAQPADDDAAPDPSPIPKAPPGVARAYDLPYRSDTLELKMERAGREGSEIEYFVRMKAGETLVYSWKVEGLPPGTIYSDFHGSNGVGETAQVLSYKEGMGEAAAGALTAPFDGLHGWLFKNDADKPATVKLTLAGFYDLRSIRETMGLDGPAYVPFGPPGWAHRFGPAESPKE